ncbi:hypothetical protein JCM14244_09820 [Venenivibrio stagnispumantis]|uniref:Uncharacterized protein n=1 Tax=Venenivibrio stagnispumantis TaxID=407998 RepID=A0AA46AET1_9AQUI|nr:hypothetical protein [Venenivibrio stagnispumantis]MCW4573619.1 hypothetical protein [Venenivibrio stagnispumantis]SMP14170.1 hypothetical protein SAMN06264868_11221 [Venenivibrio stagnispumantis]
MNWWEEINEFAKRMVSKYPNIIDIEIFDASYNKRTKEYTVKIGVYPYGVFFAEGTLEELEEVIKSINEFVVKERYKCPFCYTGFSDADIFGGKHRCKKCNANILVAGITSSDIHDNDAFAEIILAVKEKYGDEQGKFVEKMITEYGYKVEDVFENVDFFQIGRTPAYAIQGEYPVIKPIESVLREDLLKWHLISEEWNLTYINRKYDEEIWEKKGKKIGISGDDVVIECDFFVDAMEFEEETGEEFWGVYFYEFEEYPDMLIGKFPYGEYITGMQYKKNEIIEKLKTTSLAKIIEDANNEFKNRQEEILKKYR